MTEKEMIREAQVMSLRKLRAEAERAEVELETAKIVREHVRNAARASDLPSLKLGGSS